MATIYDYDLHGLGEAAFRSIQSRAFMGEEIPGAQTTSAPADDKVRWSVTIPWWAVGLGLVGLGAGIYYARKES